MPKKHLAEDTEEISAEIKKLADKRWNAKKNKDWATADSIRNELKNLGYEIKDTQDGYTITKI